MRNLRKEFKKRAKKQQKKEDCIKVAVRNTTFCVEDNEVFGLLGPNGAGKTTTLNMIIAETSATRGKVRIMFKNLGKSVIGNTMCVLKLY